MAGYALKSTKVIQLHFEELGTGTVHSLTLDLAKFL